MVGISLFLIRIEAVPDQPRLTAARQEDEWARQRAKAPFQLRVRRSDGSQQQFATGGPGYVVIQPNRVEDFGLAVGGTLQFYSLRC